MTPTPDTTALAGKAPDADGETGNVDAMERDVLTSDGLAIHIRAARPDDVDALARFHNDDLSDASSYYRFFGLRPNLTSERLMTWATADGRRHATLLAFHDGRIVAVGLYRGLDALRAEAAFAVADRLQHRGLATILLEDLAVLAKRAGYTQLVAETLPGNVAMRSVFHDVGLGSKSTFSGGVSDIVIQLGDASQVSVVHPTAATIDGIAAYRKVAENRRADRSCGRRGSCGCSA